MPNYAPMIGGEVLKKYWREIALFVLVGVVFFLFQAWQEATDKALAGAIAEKARAALALKIKAISHEYAKLQLEVDKQIADSKATIGDISAKADKFLADSRAAQAKIKQMQSVNDQLQATNYELELCQQFVIKQRNDYTFEIKNRDILWGNKFQLKVEECTAKENEYINTVDRMTKSLAWYAVKDKRRWVLGPQAGYGPMGWYIGVGITFRVFEFGF
jgi:hypothetical protein